MKQAVKNYMLPLGVLGFFALMVVPAAGMEGGEKTSTDVYPLMKYEYRASGSRGLHSPGSGVLLMKDEALFLGFYTLYNFTESPGFDYPERYHSIELVYDGGRDRHNILYIFKSEADRPVESGLAGFSAAAVYGYEVLDSPRNSLVLGGGLAVGDFGIELEDSRPWPLIPIPLIRFSHESRMLSASFDFITGPNLSLTLMPERHLRVQGDFGMDQFRDIYDLLFEISLMYRFFGEDHPMGDFAGIAGGVKNEGYSFAVEGEDSPVEFINYSCFASLDLTLLKCTGGYIFQGRDRYGDGEPISSEEGFFLSLEGMYQF